MKIKQNTARFDKKITYAEAHKKILKILKTELKIPVNKNKNNIIVLGEDKIITLHIKPSDNYVYSKNNYRECNIAFKIENIGQQFHRGFRNFDILEDNHIILKQKFMEISDMAKELQIIADNNAILVDVKTQHINKTFKNLISERPLINIDIIVNIKNLAELSDPKYNVNIHMQGHFKHTLEDLTQEQTQNLLDKFKNLNDTMNEYDKGDY